MPITIMHRFCTEGWSVRNRRGGVGVGVVGVVVGVEGVHRVHGVGYVHRVGGLGYVHRVGGLGVVPAAVLPLGPRVWVWSARGTAWRHRSAARGLRSALITVCVPQHHACF